MDVVPEVGLRDAAVAIAPTMKRALQVRARD